MDPENDPFNSPDRSSAREDARQKLKARYEIRGEYVGASTVALILGLGRTTVHDQVKERRFVIPHRLINRKPMFLLDDLAEWMVGGEPARRVLDELLPSPPDPRGRASTPTFRYPDAEAAYLRLCSARGIRPDI